MRQSRKARLGLSVCAAALACAGALYLYFMGPGNVPLICVFHEITGLYCPGCGAGRACYSILHGEFLEAFCYNPLMTVLLPLIGAVSAVVHNVAQLLVAAWMTASTLVFYYFPYLLLIGIASGLLTGSVLWLLIRFFPILLLRADRSVKKKTDDSACKPDDQSS